MATRKTRKTTKKAKPAPRKKTTTKRKQPARRRKGSPRRKAPARAKPTTRPIELGLTLDRKLDLLGVGLSLIGLLTLLSLLSSNRSSLTGAWISLLGRAVGWGLFVFPLGLIALGLWLILRHFERIPQVVIERILGVILLYINLLAGFHFLLFPPNRAVSATLAAASRGGGYIGNLILWIGLDLLGEWGTAIALLAWLLIALTLALDTSIVDLFRWLPPLYLRLTDFWDERRGVAKQLLAKRSRPPRDQTSPKPAVGTTPVTPQIIEVPSASLTSPSLETEARAWTLPQIDQTLDVGGQVSYDDEYDRQRARVIEETLASFGAPAKVVEINRGPTITQFGVEPDFVASRSGRMRVRVGKIASLADDLALALAASRIRVEAPVPGKGFVGIEVPNDEIALVALRDVIESQAFHQLKSTLRFALGQDVAGNAVAADLMAMPHLLIAGATGSGKSVCVNALISCLLLHNTPNDLRMIMVDPKRVELTGYNGIPHLLAPVVVNLERVIGALQWVTREMDQRYHKLAKAGARHLDEYNAQLEARGEPRLPHLVVIVDELADLMMLAPDETERSLTRLAQLARATGIHLVISTQRPSVDVVTGLIKANFPARIAFAVASSVDSRVILDQPGAERLLGSGDMLFQAPDAPSPVRLQGVFVSDSEILRLVQYWRGFSGTADTIPVSVAGPVDAPPPGIPLQQMEIWEEMSPQEDQDPLLDESIALFRRHGRASISMLQRRLRIGYTRAARLVETMEEKGIIGPPQRGSQTREVLDYGQSAPPADD